MSDILITGQDFSGTSFNQRLGAEGEWDSGCVLPSSTVIYRPERMELYYSAAPFDHSGFSRIPYGDIPKECIGLATLRPDGFVFLIAGEEPCELMTRPFAVDSGEIYLNATVSGGYVLTELCDTNWKAIEGFAFEDCVPFEGDCIAAKVRWKGNPSLQQIEHRIIRVKIRAVRAEL